MTSHSDTPSCNPYGDPPISVDCWYNCTLDDIAGEDKRHRLRKVRQLVFVFILVWSMRYSFRSIMARIYKFCCKSSC